MKKNRDAELHLVIFLLSALIVYTFVADLVVVIKGSVDANRYIPFFWPVFLSVFVGITLAMKRHGRIRNH